MGSKHVEGKLTQHCMLVGSLVSQAIGLTGERLVWIYIDNRSEGHATVRYIGSSNVTDLPTWMKGPNGTTHDEYNFGPPRNIVFIRNGGRYVIYRFAVYMDLTQVDEGTRRQEIFRRLLPDAARVVARQSTRHWSTACHHARIFGGTAQKMSWG